MNFPFMKMKKQFLGLYWDVHWVIYYRYSHPELSQGNLLLVRFEKKTEGFAFKQKFTEKYFMQILKAEKA